jgi:hypothetical protein
MGALPDREAGAKSVGGVCPHHGHIGGFN